MSLHRHITRWALGLSLAASLVAGRDASAARDVAPEMAIVQNLERLLDQRTALETEARQLKSEHDALLDRLLPLKREQEADYSWLRGASIRSLSGQAQELADALSRLQSRIARLNGEMDGTAAPLLDDLSAQLMREADNASRLRGKAREAAEGRIERIVQAIDIITARYDLTLRNDMAALVIPRILLEKESREIPDLESLEQRLSLLDDTLARTRAYESRMRQQAEKARSYAMVKSTLDRERKRRSLFGDTGFSSGVMVRTVETVTLPPTDDPDGDPAAIPPEDGVVAPDNSGVPGSEGQPGDVDNGVTGGEPNVDGSNGGPVEPTDVTGTPGDTPTGGEPVAPTGTEVVTLISAISLDPLRATAEEAAPAALTTEALRSLFAEGAGVPAESQSLVFAPTADADELERQLEGLRGLKHDLADQKSRLEQQIQKLKSRP